MDVWICDVEVYDDRGSVIKDGQFMVREDAVKDPIHVQQKANKLLRKNRFCSKIIIKPKRSLGIGSRPLQVDDIEYTYHENSGLYQPPKVEKNTVDDQINNAIKLFDDIF